MPGISEQDPVAMHLFRSISAREIQASSSVSAPIEKRRSTSFDDTHGELARACAGVFAEGEPVAILSKKKLSFWRSTVWKFSKGKKATKETLTSIMEKEEGSAPKWKRLLQKLRAKAKEVRRPAICSSSLDVQVANCDRSGSFREQGINKAGQVQAEKLQRLYSVYPEPIPVSRRAASVPIWERRSVSRPPTLDLNDLKVTGLRHVSRPHQTRG